MQDESAEIKEAEVEKDICIDCGTGIDKPKPVQVTAFMLMQPLSLCSRCEEQWRWRQQICRPRPYQLPLWRPKVKAEC